MKVELLDEIGKKLEKQVNNSDEFETVDEYVNFILGQVARRIEISESDNERPLSEEEKKKSKERLKQLGYER
ncbi:MAG: CopG family transcriptional regulator [Candidatus Woesearchaeota archaeon]|nr:MAG: CopG family transcriptional regulator [Candidatus Woesearchaeota archaeon]